MSAREELARIIDDTPPVPDGDGGLTDWVLRQNLAAADAILDSDWLADTKAGLLREAAESLDAIACTYGGDVGNGFDRAVARLHDFADSIAIEDVPA